LGQRITSISNQISKPMSGRNGRQSKSKHKILKYQHRSSQPGSNSHVEVQDATVLTKLENTKMKYLTLTRLFLWILGKLWNQMAVFVQGIKLPLSQ
jgi:hypothetical protein